MVTFREIYYWREYSLVFLLTTVYNQPYGLYFHCTNTRTIIKNIDIQAKITETKNKLQISNKFQNTYSNFKPLIDQIRKKIPKSVYKVNYSPEYGRNKNSYIHTAHQVIKTKFTLFPYVILQLLPVGFPEKSRNRLSTPCSDWAVPAIRTANCRACRA